MIRLLDRVQPETAGNRDPSFIGVPIPVSVLVFQNKELEYLI
jgi:hypothetical protein